MSDTSKQIVDAFIASVADDADQWVIDEFSMTHRKSGLSFRLYEWPFIVVVHPFRKNLGIIQSQRFKYYLSKFKAWKAEQMLAAQ